MGKKLLDRDIYKIKPRLAGIVSSVNRHAIVKRNNNKEVKKNVFPHPVMQTERVARISRLSVKRLSTQIVNAEAKAVT